jgi:hypothetical protein
MKYITKRYLSLRLDTQTPSSNLHLTKRTNHLHGWPLVRRQPLPKSLGIPRLHKHRSRPCELTHQPLTGVHIRQYTPRRHALEHVFAIPRNKMPVIDDVLFVFLQLFYKLATGPKSTSNRICGEDGNDRTYILPDNRAKTRTPQNPLPTNLIHEQSLAAEHGLAQSLALVLGHNALCACQKRVSAHAPLFVAAELDNGDIADRRRGEQEFAGTGVY